MPTKKTAAAHGGSVCVMYSEIARSGRPSEGTTAADATPTTTPRRMSGAPMTAARKRPFCPSSGVRADMDIWNAACASGTFTMNVPNHATMSETPAFAGATISGFARVYSPRPSRPGEARIAQTPTRNIAAMTMTFIVWLNATERMPPKTRNAKRMTAVSAIDCHSVTSVMTVSAEANAIAVASEYMGKVKPVMTAATPCAARPNRSPMMPVTVTTSFLRSGFTSRSAMRMICTVSATPYQMAETPVR